MSKVGSNPFLALGSDDEDDAPVAEPVAVKKAVAGKKKAGGVPGAHGKKGGKGGVPGAHGKKGGKGGVPGAYGRKGGDRRDGGDRRGGGRRDGDRRSRGGAGGAGGSRDLRRRGDRREGGRREGGRREGGRREGGRREGGRREGGRGGGGGGGGGGGAPRRGREHDRHSGTGRRGDPKKGGRGYWTGGDSDMTDGVAPSDLTKADAARKAKVESEDGAPADGEAEEVVAEVEEEEEDNTMDLAAYKRELAAKRSGELFAAREGRNVEADFKEAEPLAKKEEDVFMVMGGGKSKSRKAKKGAKALSLMDFHKKAPDAASIGGRRGRGGDRGGRRGERAPDPRDPAAFPALG